MSRRAKDARRPGRAAEQPATEQSPEHVPARRRARAEVGRRRHGMFGVTRHRRHLRVRRPGPAGRRCPAPAERPYGGWFDEVADALEARLRADRPRRAPSRRSSSHRGEITFHVRREDLPFVAQLLRDDEALRFELCSGVSGVHYPDDTGRELHAVYHLLSMTHNRRIRLEVTCPDADPHIPSVVAIYPTNDWHERETFDFFGIVFDGHPALTRIQMPDDWPGHPQRKDYPLGGIPVEYKGATIPPPDTAEDATTDEHHHSDPYAATTPTPPRAGSSPSPARTGTRSSPGIAEEARRARSSSTWARSTRRPTACSG